MAEDTKYLPVPYIYRSRGLVAREITDRAPENTYLNMMNCQEREEEALSSRYGTVIINRDAVGSGTSNYALSTAVVALSRFVYQGNIYRYASVAAGALYRIIGDSQGQYAQLTLPLSAITGAPVVMSGVIFGSLIQSCFETSQPYLFIYDGTASIKDLGVGNPQLTGIDPPTYTANTVPYSPLLTLIDNFDSGNSYSTSGFDGGSPWTFESITTIDGTNGTPVTDFFQFIVGGTTISGGSATATQLSYGSNAQSVVISGFPSVVVSPVTTVTVTVPVQSNGIVGGVPGPSYFVVGNTSYSYSIDGGTTWTVFGSDNGPEATNVGAYPFIRGGFTWVFSVTGLTNLDLFQIQAQAISGVYNDPSSTLTLTSTADVLSVTVSTPDVSVLGGVCNGILSVLNTNSSINIPIASIIGSGFSAGLYTTLTVITASPHGRTTGDPISIYGTSNSIADGFYQATVIDSVTFTVPFFYSIQIGSYGGFVNGGASEPSTCVLTNEYSQPYPVQFSAFGFYEELLASSLSFPIGAWSGQVDTNSTATVGVTADFNLSVNNTAYPTNAVTDADLIVLTLNVGSPANISNIRLQFDVNGSGYTSSYYYANISPAYYQGNIANQIGAYESTQNQILADTLGLITGQPPATTSAQLQPSNFSTGSGTWVAVYIPRGNFLPVGSAGQSGLDWTNITGWQLVIETTATVITGDGSSTVACNGLYMQWGYGPSSFAGIGYDYRYTYYNADTGTESSPSPEQKFSKQFGYLSSLSSPIYLRQAVRVTGQYSFDPQVTHIRIYRRGGTLGDNWIQLDQTPNLTGSNFFLYKDVIPDLDLDESEPLVLDNDPPVTSSLVSSIQTTLAAATIGPGNLYYSMFTPQLITVADSSAVFVPTQEVEIGGSENLEVVTVIDGGTGQFTTIVRLQHNLGDAVNAYSVPRQPCSLCALAYNQVWLAGDENNPGYLYYSKPGYPENFGPENYLNVSSPSDPINAVINWRGTLFVGTQNTWYIIQGGADPIAQPTGSQHGIIARGGWTQTEGAIWYRAADGLREFRGSEGTYASLPVEWIYRDNPLTPLPLADPTQSSQDVMCYYNNDVYVSYISLTGTRYRLIWSTLYKRYRIDSLPMTAMLWEQDTNTFLGAYQLSSFANYIVQDQVYSQDYDDGGWSGGALVHNPINLSIQLPYQDLEKPHFPKQWNVIETDVNTQNQVMTTTLIFDDGAVTLPLANAASAQRKKIQLQVQGGAGQQGYRMSLLHTIGVLNAPIFYQENIYAAELAAYRYTFDTYWILGGTDEFKLVKECYFDWTSATSVQFSLYADNSTTPYYTFTLPAEPLRNTVRVRFPAMKMRQFRMIGNIFSGNVGVQMWKAPQLRWKPCREASGYSLMDLVT